MNAFVVGGSAALVLVLAMLPLAAVPAADAVLPLGIFSSIKATADHIYGHEVRLWRAGNRVVGQMLTGMPIPMRGAKGIP